MRPPSSARRPLARRTTTEHAIRWVAGTAAPPLLVSFALRDGVDDEDDEAVQRQFDTRFLIAWLALRRVDVPAEKENSWKRTVAVRDVTVRVM